MHKNLKILVVEDELISRILMEELLAPYGICHVATNGKEALEIIEKSYDTSDGKYDLVCLDIMMPGIDGHKVLQEVRRMEEDRCLAESATTKVFMTTTLSDIKNIMRAFNDGRCQAYLTKPINRNNLEKNLHKFHLI